MYFLKAIIKILGSRSHIAPPAPLYASHSMKLKHVNNNWTRSKLEIKAAQTFILKLGVNIL